MCGLAYHVPDPFRFYLMECLREFQMICIWAKWLARNLVSDFNVLQVVSNLALNRV